MNDEYPLWEQHLERLDPDIEIQIEQSNVCMSRKKDHRQ